jgi:hypothetical protein
MLGGRGEKGMAELIVAALVVFFLSLAISELKDFH